LIGVGLGADERAIGGKIPEIGAAGVKVSTRVSAKKTNELGGIAVLRSGLGKLEKKLLERLVRLRRVAGTRNSRWGCQWFTNLWLSG